MTPNISFVQTLWSMIYFYLWITSVIKLITLGQKTCYLSFVGENRGKNWFTLTLILAISLYCWRQQPSFLISLFIARNSPSTPVGEWTGINLRNRSRNSGSKKPSPILPISRENVDQPNYSTTPTEIAFEIPAWAAIEGFATNLLPDIGSYVQFAQKRSPYLTSRSCQPLATYHHVCKHRSSVQSRYPWRGWMYTASLCRWSVLHLCVWWSFQGMYEAERLLQELCPLDLNSKSYLAFPPLDIRGHWVASRRWCQ